MRSLFVSATALTMLCGAAMAQTSTSGSTSGANVDTSSGSNSSSVSNPKVNVYGNPIGNGASSSNSSTTSRSGSNSRSGAAASSGQSSSTSGVIINNTTTSGTSSGGTSGTSNGTDPATATNAAGTTSPSNYTSTQTLRNTPEIVAPSIVGGNPCTVGMSGGVALPGFGIVTGGSWEGKACERRQLAALLYNMGHDIPGAKGGSLEDAAVEVLCADVSVREAMRRIGQPCVADRGLASSTPSSVGIAAPVALPAPKNAPARTSTPIAMAAPITRPIASSTPAVAVAQKQYPDWCYTASAEQRRANKSCGG
jgi:hypothetical protein